MILRWRRARRVTTAEINVTAFMNLMVVLTPFLLVTAVFTQMAVQELNLPGAAEAAADSKPPPQPLTVTVRRASLIVTAAGQRHVLPATPQGQDLPGLGQVLLKLKEQRPEEDKVTVLLEPQIPYDTLIQVMDTARFYPGEVPLREMYPNVSIGDAS